MFLFRNFLFLENNRKTGSYQILFISYSSPPFLWEYSCLSRFFSNCLILICLYDLISFVLCFSQTILLLLHFSSFFISDFFPLLHFFVQPSLIGHSPISLPLIFLFLSNIYFYFFPYFFPFSLFLFIFPFISVFNFFCISFSFILPSFHDSLLLFPVFSFSFLSLYSCFYLSSIFFLSVPSPIF